MRQRTVKAVRTDIVVRVGVAPGALDAQDGPTADVALAVLGGDGAVAGDWVRDAAWLADQLPGYWCRQEVHRAFAGFAGVLQLAFGLGIGFLFGLPDFGEFSYKLLLISYQLIVNPLKPLKILLKLLLSIDLSVLDPPHSFLHPSPQINLTKLTSDLLMGSHEGQAQPRRLELPLFLSHIIPLQQRLNMYMNRTIRTNPILSHFGDELRLGQTGRCGLYLLVEAEPG
jgi:hypothetical protein